MMMMMASYKLLFSITFLLSLVCKSLAIQCFYCTSANNSACLDPMEYDPETRARIIPIIRCEDTRVLNVESFNFFCRKILQTIYLPRQGQSAAEAQVRVTRGCGWIREEKPCYRSYTHDHLETVCQCFGDYCNTAVVVLPKTVTIFSVALSLGLYLFY